MELLIGVDDSGDEGRRGRGGGEEVEDDLIVRGGVEDEATVLELAMEGSVVNEVAVVGDGDGAEAVASEEGLNNVEWGRGGAVGQTRPPTADNFFFFLCCLTWPAQLYPTV